MKKEANPTMVLIAAVIALLVIGGLYYRFIGGGADQKSDVASPYGMPKPGEAFKTPPPGGSGRNTITGELLPTKPGAQSVGTETGMPRLPGGVSATPNGQPAHP